MSSLEIILEAPCCFCGYKGSGYYQSETHEKHCCWYRVGGLSLRVDEMVKTAKERRLRILPNFFDVDEYYKE
jgi:hypothetical protein